ncbi:hypothetical protein RhiirC2_797946 [Rhizophagus irregularis]|uniref:Uncharacterized protein n=1 Tax=Rhizophagus irregularis TaxID=588596 RepID=A0A2N1M772_9GLOM|nr:hypothetical protein RhiirC2_797946 [Rhizophagus irregularis]
MEDISNENKNRYDKGDAITYLFVPTIPLTQRENAIINDTLDRIQSNEQPVLWPEINRSPINAFQTSGDDIQWRSTISRQNNEIREKAKKDKAILNSKTCAADFHWPNLHRLMPDDEDAQLKVINNPHITAWFFTKRFESFFNDVLKEK